MKITAVEAIAVRVPLKAGLTTKTAHGEHVDSDYVMVRLQTDGGMVGWGEATLAPRWSGEISAGCQAVVRDLLGPALVGQNPLDRTRLCRRMDRELKLNPFTKAALEMALWDLAGKAAGLPVYALLGGLARDEIPIKMVVGAFDVPAACALAERFLTWGARSIKIKVGLDPKTDLARVQAIRKLAGPDISLGIDANCGWTPATARRLLAELAPTNLIYAEQPVPPGNAAQMAELRRDVATPLMADESLFTLSDAWTLAEAHAVDVFSVYPGKHGGLAATQQIVHVAQAAGLACCVGSNLELGVGTAAMLHVAAALPGINSEQFPADIIGPLYHEADLLRTPLELGPAVARPLRGPGLGIEVDEAQLARFRVG